MALVAGWWPHAGTPRERFSFSASTFGSWEAEFITLNVSVRSTFELQVPACSVRILRGRLFHIPSPAEVTTLLVSHRL